MTQHVLLRRTGALGDVILTTPVIRRLQAEHGPGTRVTVATAHTGVFDQWADVAGVPDADAAQFDRFVNLDGVYEGSPQQHIVSAYMKEVFGDDNCAERDRQQTLFPLERRTVLRQRNLIVVHGTGTSWRNQLRSPAWWSALHAGLRAAGYNTISVGSIADRGGGDIDLRGKTTLSGLYRLVQAAACFVGSDSGPLHVAGATSTPIVGLFTCANPAFRLPWRGGRIGGGCIGLTPHLVCAGCLHNEPPPVTSCGCRLGTFACAEGYEATRVDEVIDAVRELLR